MCACTDLGSKHISSFKAVCALSRNEETSTKLLFDLCKSSNGSVSVEHWSVKTSKLMLKERTLCESFLRYRLRRVEDGLALRKEQLAQNASAKKQVNI
jgi:hypothetical protein